MTAIFNLTGPGAIRRLRRILATPVMQRGGKFGRAWAWQIANCVTYIRDEHPELISDLETALRDGGPGSVDELVSVAPSTGFSRN